ncbi:hypothetical protein ABTX77_40190 [Streptomyces sp. NPDC097704]|uniref:hypothetical protein n=1 Tax=Streptomyces sp. NPDC097704 TaxID=3157101 RepID=UPI00332758DC
MVVREKLRTTTTAAGRGRAYDVVAHQQAAMPEQLFAPPATDPDHDQEPEPEHREAIDMTVLRALRASRADVEALDLTSDRLRRLQDAFTKAADDSRARADRHTDQDDADCSAPGAQG